MENAPEFMDLQRQAADEVAMQPPALELGKVGYEAYRKHTGGCSLATGAPIPEYKQLPEAIKDAWAAAALAIRIAVLTQAASQKPVVG
jgi:hypothetical protein